MNKYKTYINELTGTTHWKISDDGERLIINYDFFDSTSIGYILNENKIPYETNVWASKIQVIDVIKHIRDNKINEILNG